LNQSSQLPYRSALVTGGAGFIGSHVVDALVARGCRTTVIDDVSTGSATNVNAHASLVTHDIADPDVARVVEQIAPEVVIHAAAQASVPSSMEDPQRDRSVNLDGTRHVLEGARRARVKRVVFLSSGGAVYGSADGATENTLPAPESYYGIHKLAAEAYVALAGIPYANLRLANVYGPRQSPGLEGAVVAVFASRVASGQPATIHGDGQQSRDFVYVADVVEAVLAAAAASKSGTWNVSTGTGTTVERLLELVQETLGSRVEVSHGPSRPGDVAISRLDSTKISSDLGWRPRYAIADGLRALTQVTGDRELFTS